MADISAHVEIRQLSDWPDEHLVRVHRLVTGELRRFLELPENDPARIEGLQEARDDAELFGIEMLERGLL